VIDESAEMQKSLSVSWSMKMLAQHCCRGQMTSRIVQVLCYNASSVIDERFAC